MSLSGQRSQTFVNHLPHGRGNVTAGLRPSLHYTNHLINKQTKTHNLTKLTLGAFQRLEDRVAELP